MSWRYPTRSPAATLLRRGSNNVIGPLRAIFGRRSRYLRALERVATRQGFGAYRTGYSDFRFSGAGSAHGSPERFSVGRVVDETAFAKTDGNQHDARTPPSPV